MSTVRACDICGNGADYANLHHDAEHAFTYAAQEVRFEDLRPGDRVRVTDITEGVVTVVGPQLQTSHEGGAVYGWTRALPKHTARTWELNERPKPEVKLGSVWVDPADGTEYVALRGNRFTTAVKGSGVQLTKTMLARLVPAEDIA